MPVGRLDSAIHQLRRAALAHAGADVGDAELVEQFVRRRDGAAFESLVRRHGSMVLGVCRRVLRNEADAEDAFQATFLVLACKAASIVPRARVGNWLHGVAHRTALKARAARARRGLKESAALPQSRAESPDPDQRQLLEALDGELRVLPEKYRVPIVLCDLEGRSYQEAARQLGCPLGTLSGRLTRARTLLANRLARRGLALSGGLVSATLAGTAASAAVSPLLVATTVKAASLTAAGQEAATGAVSAEVASLVGRILKMMQMSKLRIMTTAVLLAVGAAGVVAWTCRAEEPADGRREPLPAKADSPRAAEARTAAAGRAGPETEAEFTVKAVDERRHAVSFVVTGTSAPVLQLPVKKDVRVVTPARERGLDGLRPGARVFVRMDRANRSVQEIRFVEDPGTVGRDEEAGGGQKLPPSEAEVLRALPRSWGDTPVESITYELIFQRRDEPRFVPLVGAARLAHEHWKCTVYGGKRVAVVYLDRSQLIPDR